MPCYETLLRPSPTLFAQARQERDTRLVFQIDPTFCIWVPYQTGQRRLFIEASWGPPGSEIAARVYWDDTDLDESGDVTVIGYVRIDKQGQWQYKSEGVFHRHDGAFERLGRWDGARQRIAQAFEAGAFERPPFAEHHSQFMHRLEMRDLRELPNYR